MGIETVIAWARWIAVCGVLALVAAAVIAFARTGRAKRPKPIYRMRSKKNQRGSIGASAGSWRDAA